MSHQSQRKSSSFLRSYPKLIALSRAALRGDLSQLPQILPRNGESRLVDIGSSKSKTAQKKGTKTKRRKPKKLTKLSSEANPVNSDEWMVTQGERLEVKHDDVDEGGLEALHWIVESGHFQVLVYLVALEIAQYLLSVGKEITNDRTDHGMTLLHLATQEEDLDLVKLLTTEYEMSVDLPDDNGRSPLHLACSNGQRHVVHFLVNECGANTEARDHEEVDSPLHYAINHRDVVDFLVNQCRVDIDAKNEFGETPLHKASGIGRSDIVAILHKGGAAVDAFDGSDQTPLFHAISGGHKEVVEYLVAKCGADVEVMEQFSFFFTPIQMAIKDGHSDIVFYLAKEGGVDVNAILEGGSTVLHTACWYGRIDIVDFLLAQCGADIQARDDIGDTPLHCASGVFGRVDIVDLLVNQYGADFEVVNNAGATPLHVASISGPRSVVEFLVNRCGADIHARNDCGRTPLHLACSSPCCERTDVVRFLVNQCGANIEATDCKGKTALHMASECGVEDKVDFLACECGANVNARNFEGQTPLHVVSHSGRLDSVKTFVDKCNADIKAVDNEGRTPLQLAMDKHYKCVVDFLLKRGMVAGGDVV